MFYECSSLKELNLSKSNTNNITNMSHMFYESKSLEEIVISEINANKAKEITSMFKGCHKNKINK